MTTRYQDNRYGPRDRWHEPEMDRSPRSGWSRFRAYLAGLSLEQWLLFLAGLTVGLILG